MKQPLTLLLMILLGALCLLSTATTAQAQQQAELNPQDAGAPDAVRAPNGKIVIVGPDGKKRELDTSNSAGIILKQSVQSVMENGEKQTRVQGKAVVIGPDGKRTEFDLAEPLETGEGDHIMRVPGLGRIEQVIGGLPLDPKLQTFLTDGARGMPGRGNVGKYMLGVHCKPVSPALRYHLDLSDDVGLMVESVTKNSPAAVAGIQKHDILLYANQAGLSTVDDLVNAIDKAGDEGLAVSLHLLSKGKEVGAELEPIERPALQAGARPGLDGVQWGQLGPGIIIGGEGFEQQMKQMEEQMRKMHEQMKTLQDQALEGRLDNADQ